MELSKKDRLILINQYKILAELNKNEKAYYEELIDVLENGYSIFYNSLDKWISEEMTKDQSKLVLDILDIYRSIEDLKRATNNQKLMEHPSSIFRGFDGNNESEYRAFCLFLIEKQEKFQEQLQYFLKTDRLNSHMPMLNKYKRMVAMSQKFDIWHLSVNQALEILNA